jgi:hypothetical protein
MRSDVDPPPPSLFYLKLDLNMPSDFLVKKEFAGPQASGMVRAQFEHVSPAKP